MVCLSFMGGRLEEEVAPANHYETPTGSGTTGGKDLH